MENLDALCAAVLACEGKDVIDLLGVLLRWCREHEAVLRAAYDRSDAKQRMVACERAVGRALGPLGDALPGGDLAALSGILRAYAAAPGTPSITARGAAQAIHERSVKEIRQCFQRRGAGPLAPNEPFPVADPPLKGIFGKNLNSSPDRFFEQIDTLRTLRLAPPDLRPYEVSVIWQEAPVLARLYPDTTLAAALPNAGLDELTWDRFTRDGERRFYGVRPRDRDRQRERILRLLDEADRAGAQVAVLPELSVDAGLLDDVRAWWRGRRSLRLLVAGSHHLETAEVGERRNVAVLMTPEGEAVHHKYNRFDFPDVGDDGAPPRELRVEDIRTTPPRLTVHMSGRWSYTTLICKDLMDPRAVELLVQLRVRIVLVPSCSPKTPAFETRARQLATDAQSIVVIGNTPPGADDSAAALFGRPTLQKPLVICSGSDIPLPAAWIFSLDGELESKKIS